MIFYDTNNVVIGNKEVKSIKTVDGDTIYDKNNPRTAITTLNFQNTLSILNINNNGDVTGEDIIIDWGDGVTTDYSSSTDWNHTYTQLGAHTILVRNARSLNENFLKYNDDLTSVTIADTVHILDEYCFAGCSNLNAVNLSNAVKIIEYSCFNGCNLSSIVLPSHLSRLGSFSFQDNDLIEVDIPASVTSIGGSVFKGNSNLKYVFFNWDNLNEIIDYNYGVNTWFDTGVNVKLVVPDGTVAVYEAKYYPSNLLVEYSDYGIHLTVTSDKDILSYYDNDTCTLTATLKEDGVPIPGETLTMEVYHNDVLQETLPVTDNNDGTYTASYVSKGTGDINIKAKCMNLVKTYVIEDCYIYDTTEHSRSHNTSSPVSNEVINGFSYDNTVDWVVSFDLKVTGQGQRIDIVPPSESLNHHLGFGKSTDNDYFRAYFGKANGGEEFLTSAVTINNNVYYSIEISKIGVIPHFKINGTEFINGVYAGEPISNYYSLVTWLSNYNLETIKFTQWRANTIYIKNIKVKPL